VFIKDETEIVNRVHGAERTVFFLAIVLLFESDEKKFSFRGGER